MVLERKLAAEREELALGSALAEMQTQLKSAERDRPAMEGDSSRSGMADAERGRARPG